MVGTNTRFCASMYGAKSSALVSSVTYSSQPEESTRMTLEALGVVTVVVFPLHAYGHTAKFGNRQRRLDPNAPIALIDEKHLSKSADKLHEDLIGIHVMVVFRMFSA